MSGNVLTAEWAPKISNFSYQHIGVDQVAGAIGASIRGVDIADDPTDEIIAEIRQALDDHLVIFFRDQDITPLQQLAFAKRFGNVIEYPLVQGLEECPQVAPVVKLADERVNFGGLWHADTTYLDEPPMGAILLAKELPPFGGDTIFANQQLAYETLSDGMKNILDNLTVIQSSKKAAVTRTREDRLKTGAIGGNSDEGLVAEHPAVIRHPRTGRKSLFINSGHTVRFKEMTEDESAPILDYLYQHQVRPEFTYRFTWQVGSIAFWDNFSCQHNPVNDYHNYKRVMHRVTIGGGRPKR